MDLNSHITSFLTASQDPFPMALTVMRCDITIIQRALNIIYLLNLPLIGSHYCFIGFVDMHYSTII